MFEELLVDIDSFRWKRPRHRYFNLTKDYFIEKGIQEEKIVWKAGIVFVSKLTDDNNLDKIMEIDKSLKHKRFNSLKAANQFIVQEIIESCSDEQLKGFNPQLKQASSVYDNYLIFYSEQYPLHDWARRPEIISKQDGADIKKMFPDRVGKWFINDIVQKDIEKKLQITVPKYFVSKNQAFKFLYQLLIKHLPLLYDKQTYNVIKSYLLHNINGYQIDSYKLNTAWWVMFIKPDIDLNNILN